MTLSPKLPSSLAGRKRLQQNLELIGFGPRFSNFPWSITSSRMVDKLTTALAILDKLQGNAYQGAVCLITQELIAKIYGTQNEGDERPLENKKQHKSHFEGKKDSIDGYPIEACKLEELEDIFWYLCPFLDPLLPNKVHIYRFNQVYLLLYKHI